MEPFPACCIACPRDGTAKVWHGNGPAYERTFHMGTAWISDACWLRNQSKMMFSCMDRNLYVCEATSGELRRTYTGQKYRAELRPAVAPMMGKGKKRGGLDDAAARRGEEDEACPALPPRDYCALCSPCPSAPGAPWPMVSMDPCAS